MLPLVDVVDDDGVEITPAESREDPECLKIKFRELCNPQTNVTMKRHMFFTRNQRQGETVESYVSDLRNRHADLEIYKTSWLRTDLSQAYTMTV